MLLLPSPGQVALVFICRLIEIFDLPYEYIMRGIMSGIIAWADDKFTWGRRAYAANRFIRYYPRECRVSWNWHVLPFRMKKPTVLRFRNLKVYLLASECAVETTRLVLRRRSVIYNQLADPCTLEREEQGFRRDDFPSADRTAAISSWTAPGVVPLRRKRTFQNHFPIFRRSFPSQRDACVTTPIVVGYTRARRARGRK